MILVAMDNPTVEQILNMKSYQLKEYLEDKHVPVPKKQSKEFLQTAALQTHADLEASKRQIITRRRSKREESVDGSTYSGMYGRSSSMPRSAPSSNSSPSFSPSVTTRSRAQAQAKTAGALQSPRKKQEDDAPVSQQEEDLSYSSYSGEHTRQAASTPPNKQTHVEPNAHIESAAYSTLHKRTHQENPDMAVVPQLEIVKETRAGDHLNNESNKKNSRPNQEIVKKIIRVSDEADHQEKHKSVKKQGTHVKGHLQGAPGARATHGQGSRMQRLKRSASTFMSQMNERVLKRLRKVPRLHMARPSAQVSVALLMCALCVAAIGAASYWYHLKKLEEQRARKRWLW
ncbi:hypothetical protein GOP47_0002824 [Adiantum capillus-veneris]|uniref:Uncharacterized protein n=1 Tax=Adiantum capillus-veneris TaxID=13818 RepID=A0A9D4ZRA1_ADICA|nr:hypothetical protein GOP47_0002824 [Adiantum capillus-veneris]